MDRKRKLQTSSPAAAKKRHLDDDSISAMDIDTVPEPEHVPEVPIRMNVFGGALDSGSLLPRRYSASNGVYIMVGSGVISGAREPMGRLVITDEPVYYTKFTRNLYSSGPGDRIRNGPLSGSYRRI